jgi:phenylacetate-CoA ligase
MVEKIYLKSPYLFKLFLINLKGFFINKRRYDKAFRSIYVKSKERLKWNEEKINDFKLKLLNRRLVEAKNNSVYYSELIPQNFRIKSFDQLSNFPIQTKVFIKENLNAVISDTKSVPYITSNTSGTTGSGLVFPESLRSEKEKWAIWWRYRELHGITQKEWCGYFGGKVILPTNKSYKKPFLKVHTTKQLMFSMYHLNHNTVESYVESINENSIRWLHGYPSTLSYFAALIIEKKLAFKHKVQWITTGAENLLLSQKKLIKKAFGINPIEHYGLSEPVANIFQCIKGHLHVDEDYSHVELIHSFENYYKIVGTSIFNECLQFLRYDTNDLVEFYEQDKCDCGYHGRVVRNIEGRREDFLTLKNGTKIGRLDHIFKDLVNIKEAQIYQHSNYNIDFRIVKSENFSEQDKIELNSKITKFLPTANFKIVFKNKIERTSAGKVKFVISEIM